MIQGSTHPRQVTDSLSEVDQATSIQDLDEGGSVLGCARMQFEARLDADHEHSVQENKVQVDEETQDKNGLPMSTRREFVRMIYAFFKVTDVRGRAIFMRKLLHIGLRSDSSKLTDQA